MKNPKFLMTVALTCILASSYGQNPPQIAVIGEASTSLKPSLVRLSLNITGIEDTYNEAASTLFERSNQIGKELKDAGFAEDEIYTSNLSISRNSRFQDGQQVQSYYASQTITVQFDFKEAKLLGVLNKLSSSTAEPDIRFSFDLSDEEKEKIKHELLEGAIKDARKTAETLARASNQTLGNIAKINYGLVDIPVGPARTSVSMEVSRSSLQSFNPEDLQMSQKVQVIFLLKQ